MPFEISQYIYGNSLVNFAGGSAESNVPYWMNRFAESGGNTYLANGGYGFLRQFADRGSPADEWGFQGVDPLWNSETEPFSSASFDTVMITPANFLQDNAVDQNYFGDDRSPLDATFDIVRGTMAEQPGAQIYIYEGWADLGATFGYPISESQLDAYHDYNAGEYHDWYVDLTDSVNQEIPDADVQLLPVASVMAELFTDGPLEGLTLDDLYVDSAPHGTETVYFLASMITYPATFGEAVPADFEVPSTVHPLVVGNLALLNTQISELMGVEAGGVVIDGGEDENTDPVVGDDVAEILQDEVLTNDMPNSQTLVGGAGLDFFEARGDLDDFTIEFQSDGSITFTETLRPHRIVTLIDIERVDFSIGHFAFDTDGNAGQAYRLYQAAFDREPDSEGLGFWIDNYDDGNVDLLAMAEYFMQSPEFVQRYGNSDSLNDFNFLTLLYANVLDRTPDSPGFDFWTEQQANGLDRSVMLRDFSESSENFANVSDAIAGGIFYL